MGTARRPGARAEELSARTEEILERGAPVITAEQAEFDRAVVRESRYLMRLLSTRRRSEHELRQRLRERDVPYDVACEAMARIIRADLIDDAAFARDWVEQRRELRGLSDEALRRELTAKGVDAAHISLALALDASDEETRARSLVRERLRSGKRPVGPGTPRDEERKVARRLDALLRRKGYDGALALRVISTELREATGR